MELLVQRKWKKQSYTISNIYINGEWFCNGLEDADRGLDSSMDLSKILSIKKPSITAIPTGTYILNLNTVSPKFKNKEWAKPYGGKVPRLLNVKGFDGVLIHVGNYPTDSSGCILIGLNTKVGMVTNSTEYYHKLMKELLKAKAKKEEIKVVIK